MKRALPFGFFALLTLAVFWRFVFLGETLFAVEALRPPAGPADPDAMRLTDNLLLRRLLLIYNDGLKSGELRMWNPYLFTGCPLYADPMVSPFYPPHLLLHAAMPADIAYELGLMLHLFGAGAAMFALLMTMGRSPPAAVLGATLWMLAGFNAMWFSTAILEGVMLFGPLTLRALILGLERRRLADGAAAALWMGLALLGSHPQHALHFFLFCMAWIAVTARRDPLFTFRFGAAFAVGTTAVGLAAILTRLDTIAQGFRDIDYEFDSVYSRVEWCLQSLAGIPLGMSSMPENAAFRYEFFAHIGVVGLGLAAFGGVKAMRGLGAAAIVLLLLAFVPPVAQLVRHVPLLNLSAPSRWVFVFGFCAALLAARGLDLLPPRRWLAAAPLLIVLELLPGFLRLNPHRDRTPLDEAPAPITALRAGRATGALYRQGTDPDLRGSDFDAGNMTLVSYGVENVAGFEALVPAPYLHFCLEAGQQIIPGGRGVRFTDFSNPLLDRAGVAYVVLPGPADLPPKFELVGRWGSTHVWRNTEAHPRVRVAGRVIGVTDPETAAMALKSFAPADAVVVEAPIQRDAGIINHTIEELERVPGRLRLKVTTDEAGMLVVSEADYPGWQATIDGAPATILRADLAFRAVELPAGTHEVAFNFAPSAVRNGIIGSAASIVLTLVYLVMAGMRNQKVT